MFVVIEVILPVAPEAEITLSLTFNDKVVKNLGFGSNVYKVYNGGSLPYKEDYYDLIISDSVLEHVDDIEKYYREGARVLKNGGIAKLNFPTRQRLWETHTRTWIIHYFPRFIRVKLWDIFTHQGGVYLEGYLNLRTVRYHETIAKKYFNVVINKTKQVIYEKTYIKYGGKVWARSLADKLMHLKIFGPLFVHFFSFFSSCELYCKN